ncbi:MAG: hypothetical protein AVDCRST_MAG31-755, partial [uncultured Sphingomonas sp.]
GDRADDVRRLQPDRGALPRDPRRSGGGRGTGGAIQAARV